MKATNTTTKATTTAKQETFTALLVNYTFQANPKTRTSEKDYTKALTDLATAVAYSVLKKCITVSQNPTLIQTRQDLARDLHTLDCIAYANEHATAIRCNADGDPYTAIIDKDLHKALTTLCGQTLGDGLDLVNDAIVTILAETEKATQRTLYTLYDECDKELYSGYERPDCVPDSITTDTYLDNDYFIEITPMCNHIQWLEKPYPVRRLKRKVWIKTSESVNGWETTTTTAIQETYKAVRRAIDQSRAVQTDPRSGYTYLADISTDPESGIGETIYRRFGKYADIGGTATDINGKETAYTADEQTANDLDTLIESMNLTAKQAKVLALRQSGYGYKAIATYLGVTQRAVAKTVEAIQAKAVAIGLTPTK